MGSTVLHSAKCTVGNLCVCPEFWSYDPALLEHMRTIEMPHVSPVKISADPFDDDEDVVSHMITLNDIPDETVPGDLSDRLVESKEKANLTLSMQSKDTTDFPNESESFELCVNEPFSPSTSPVDRKSFKRMFFFGTPPSGSDVCLVSDSDEDLVDEDEGIIISPTPPPSPVCDPQHDLCSQPTTQELSSQERYATGQKVPVVLLTRDESLDRTEARRYCCDKCPKHYAKRDNLKQHLLLHKRERDLLGYLCSTCHSMLKTERGLHEHIQLVHERAYACLCPSCGMQLSCKSALSKHLKRCSNQ